MTLPPFNSHDGRYYFVQGKDQEKIQALLDQCIQDTIAGNITHLVIDYPAVIVSSQGAPFRIFDVITYWLRQQSARTLNADEAIAFCENLRRHSRWGEIDYYIEKFFDQELQEKYFVVTGNEREYYTHRTYALKPRVRPQDVPMDLLRFACYAAVNYKIYGLSFQYLKTNYLFGLIEKVCPTMIQKLKKRGTGKLPAHIRKYKTTHMSACTNDAFAVIRIAANEHSQATYREILEYLCSVLQEDVFPRSYAIEFKGPEKVYLPITGLPKKGVHQLFACVAEYPRLYPLLEKYARLAMRRDERYTNIARRLCALPGSFAVFALGMLGPRWQPLVMEYLNLCDDEHSHIQEKFLRAYAQKFGLTQETIPVFIRGILSMQNMKYSKDYRAWIENPESLQALLLAKKHYKEIFPDHIWEDDGDDDEKSVTPEELLQYAWDSICYVFWGKDSLQHGKKFLANAPTELHRLLQRIFAPIQLTQ